MFKIISIAVQEVSVGVLSGDQLHQLCLTLRDPVTFEIPQNPQIAENCQHMLNKSTVEALNRTCPCCREIRVWNDAPRVLMETIQILHPVLNGKDHKRPIRMSVTEEESKIVEQYQDLFSANISEIRDSTALLDAFFSRCDEISRSLDGVIVFLELAFNAACTIEAPMLICRYANQLLIHDLPEDKQNIVADARNFALRSFGLKGDD